MVSEHTRWHNSKKILTRRKCRSLRPVLCYVCFLRTFRRYGRRCADKLFWAAARTRATLQHSTLWERPKQPFRYTTHFSHLKSMLTLVSLPKNVHLKFKKSEYYIKTQVQRKTTFYTFKIGTAFD